MRAGIVSETDSRLLLSPSVSFTFSVGSPCHFDLTNSLVKATNEILQKWLLIKANKLLFTSTGILYILKILLINYFG